MHTRHKDKLNFQIRLTLFFYHFCRSSYTKTMLRTTQGSTGQGTLIYTVQQPNPTALPLQGSIASLSLVWNIVPLATQTNSPIRFGDPSSPTPFAALPPGILRSNPEHATAAAAIRQPWRSRSPPLPRIHRFPVSPLYLIFLFFNLPDSSSLLERGLFRLLADGQESVLFVCI